MNIFFKYGWTIFSNLLAVAVLIAIFDSIYEDFQIAVISILVLIYVNIISYPATIARQQMDFVLIQNDEFKKIRMLIYNKMGVTTDDNDNEENNAEEVKIALENIEKTKVQFYINMFFNWAINIAMLITLFGTFLD